MAPAAIRAMREILDHSIGSGARICLKLPQVTDGMTKMYFSSLISSRGSLERVVLINNSLAVQDESVQGLIYILFGFNDFQIVLDKLKKL